MKKFADTVRRLLSIVLNLFIVWAEPIALPMSWDWGKEQMFIFYTEDSNILSACICAMVAVGQLVSSLPAGNCRAGCTPSSISPPAA